MEKLPSFVVNGGVKMPVGYRFHPTDEELVIYYLKRKVHASPLPASIIPEFDVFQTHPWGLPGDVREKRYFFYNQMNGKNNVVNASDIGHKNKVKAGKRGAGCGYWKAIDKDKQIVASDQSNRGVLGIRKTLVFCERKRPNYHHHGTKTRWLMHEYRLLPSQTNPNQVLESKTELGNWVVYGVFQKKRKPNRRSDVGVVSQLSIGKRSRRSMEVNTPSSSCSSDITELYELDDDDQEENTTTASSMWINI